MVLWEGRFSQQMDAEAWEFNASLAFDRRLAAQDVRGSQAWAKALAAAGAIGQAELSKLLEGLQAIALEFQSGAFEYKPRDEDIHTAVERRLGELVGEVAGKLHTGRSRNDQVATDLRLWMMAHLPEMVSGLTNLQGRLVDRAQQDLEFLMPGYTHLQRAQPILVGHWWLSHFWPLERDKRRLMDVLAHVQVLPLGSGALAGTPLPIDRALLATELGFTLPAPNSLDAVSDRDFAADFLYFATLCGVHLGRLAEQLIVFSSQEFGFISFSDRHATGSSLMPQKKNPDLMELIRGSSAELIGRLAGFLSVMKALPSAYDKDLQRDKPAIFFAFDTLKTSLSIMSAVVADLGVNAARMKGAISAEMMATDLADHFVTRGLPFRQAHQVVAKIMDQVGGDPAKFQEVISQEINSFDDTGSIPVADLLDPRQSINRRNATGGTSITAVKAQIEQARALLDATPSRPLYAGEGDIS